MKLMRRGCGRNIFIFVFLGVSLFILKTYRIQSSNYVRKLRKDSDTYFPDSGAKLVDSKIFWGGKVSLEDESSRVGLGEHGGPASLTQFDPKEKVDLWDMNGFNALLSDQISLDRALKDIRNPKCKPLQYNAVLPSVSVVIPFFEEHLSTLLRTVVSVINRSPPSILKEIILVDDGSSVKEFLKAPLEAWLEKNQPGCCKVIRLPDRVGLIMARQEGIKAASGEVIVVLDSHCEVITDWLPPLLEPIVADPRTAVCPLIDVINSDNFGYYPQDEGGRGAFDWRFFYKRLPLRPSDILNLPHPFENPVMNGGLFAINRKFFWELGGYDPGLRIWGGEQYNLSFKIWQCGGRLLDAPCSRVGHVFRNGGKKRPAAKNAGDFISVNYKRVALVWMDEYIDALYQRNPRLRDVEAGDVTSQIRIREQLGCKPFKWFLETVAPDLLVEYPPVEPPDFANGTIKSSALPTHCVDSGSKETGDLILYPCHGLATQYFSLGYMRNVELESEQYCWAYKGVDGMAPQIEHCEKHPGPHQTWRYDPDTQQLVSKQALRCLDANPKSPKLLMATCNDSQSQKWIFKNTNSELIRQKYPHI